MGDLDKLWSTFGMKRLKTDQDSPVFMVQRIFWLVGVPVVLHVKAHKTATTEAKTTTTTVVVASAAIEPQSQLLFVLILLNSNQFSLYYSTIAIIVNILFSSRTHLFEYVDPRVLFSTLK